MPAPKSLEQIIADLGNRIRRVEQRSPYANSGLSIPGPGVVNVDGQLQGSGFDGDLDTDDVGTIGWALNATKAALPELLLRAGSIGNDSLANPIQVSSVVGGATNFSISTTSTLKSSYTLTVPSGFTQAVVLCIASGNAVNSTALSDYLTVQAAVNGATGGGVNATIAAGSYGTTVTGVRISTLSGLAGGGTVTAEAWAGTQNGAFAANAANFVMINALAVWLR